MSGNLKKEYAELIIKNSSIITKIVDNNPRQLKRFINNLIIAYETFADKNDAISLPGLFITQIMKKRLSEFYRTYRNNEAFRLIVNDFLSSMKYFRVTKTPSPKIVQRFYRKKIESPYVDQLITEILLPKEKDKEENNNSEAYRTLVQRAIQEIRRKYKQGPGFSFVDPMSSVSREDWKVLRRYSQSLAEISNWEIYDNAIDIVEDISIEKLTK